MVLEYARVLLFPLIILSALVAAQNRQPYDGSKAADYAKKWALSPNPEYKAFENDCTNFASQALLAGGFETVQGTFLTRKNDDVWWYGGALSDASYTWGGAENLGRFLLQSKRAVKAETEAKLGLGDLVQIADKNNHVYHTMVVTDKKDANVFVSYHTPSHLNESLKVIQQRLDPSDKLIYWNVLFGK